MLIIIQRINYPNLLYIPENADYNTRNKYPNSLYILQSLDYNTKNKYSSGLYIPSDC